MLRLHYKMVCQGPYLCYRKDVEEDDHEQLRGWPESLRRVASWRTRILVHRKPMVSL